MAAKSWYSYWCKQNIDRRDACNAWIVTLTVSIAKCSVYRDVLFGTLSPKKNVENWEILLSGANLVRRRLEYEKGNEKEEKNILFSMAVVGRARNNGTVL